jgi:hypothetical protein
VAELRASFDFELLIICVIFSSGCATESVVINARGGRQADYSSIQLRPEGPSPSISVRVSYFGNHTLEMISPLIEYKQGCETGEFFIHTRSGDLVPITTEWMPTPGSETTPDLYRDSAHPCDFYTYYVGDMPSYEYRLYIYSKTGEPEVLLAINQGSPPRPSWWALTPFAVIVDVATLPFVAIYVLVLSAQM